MAVRVLSNANTHTQTQTHTNLFLTSRQKTHLCKHAEIYQRRKHQRQSCKYSNTHVDKWIWAADTTVSLAVTLFPPISSSFPLKVSGKASSQLTVFFWYRLNKQDKMCEHRVLVQWVLLVSDRAKLHELAACCTFIPLLVVLIFSSESLQESKYQAIQWEDNSGLLQSGSYFCGFVYISFPLVITLYSPG